MASADFLAAARREKAFVWTTTKAALAAGETALLIRVIQGTWNLHVEKIKVWVDSACEIAIHTTIDPATALVGTAVTGKCLDRRGADTTLSESKGDETGLSQGTIIEADYLVAKETKYFAYEGTLVIDNGKSIAVDCVHETEAIVTMWGYFKLASVG